MELKPNQILCTSGRLPNGLKCIFAVMPTNSMCGGTTYPLIKKAIITPTGMYTLLRPAWEQMIPVAPKGTKCSPHNDRIAPELFGSLTQLMQDDTRFGSKPKVFRDVVFPWERLPQHAALKQDNIEMVLMLSHAPDAPTKLESLSGYFVQTIPILSLEASKPSTRSITFLDM